MSRYERLNALLEILGRDGRLDVEQAAHELGVSAATIRRDLDDLATQGLLTRTHGGATANKTSYDLPLRYKSGRRAKQKLRIAEAAAALVSEGAVVGLNGGTTTTEVARALGSRLDLATERAASLTVVTNAVNVANDLAVRPHVKIVMPGGVVRSQSYELGGPLATEILDHISLSILFLGVDAIDAQRGACAHDEGEAAINRLMVARADRVVVVADSSKLGRSAFARICPITSVHTLITDSEASDDVVRRLEEAGVAVRRV
jgi:DeoR family transcriptional regulator, aga operon transcriptional repressor